jgi:hypothetical protein
MIGLNREGHEDVIVDWQESSGKRSGCMKLICWMVVAIILLLITLGSIAARGFLDRGVNCGAELNSSMFHMYGSGHYLL